MSDTRTEHEALVASLCDDELLEEYKKPLDGYKPSLLARFLGGFLIGSGNLFYGHAPSYMKFRAIEVIARVPYHSWTSAIFTLLTYFYSDELRALRLSTLARFTRFSAENETMHVVVISSLAREHERAGFFRHTLIPVLFAFISFWVSYVLYLVRPRVALEINYLFESHAFLQYDQFLKECGDGLKNRPITSAYLSWYGRECRNQYEFFRLVRNDEIVHRNQSVHEIALHCRRGRD